MATDDAIKNLAVLEGIISYNFKNKLYLLEAVTHNSFINEHPEHPVPSYQRLEFLGDAILQMIISEMLFVDFPNDDEGRLSVKRSVIVQKNMLYDIARVLNIDRFMLLGNSEKNRISELSKSLMSDFVESLIAAIYLDGGYESALNFCRRYFQKLVEDADHLKDEFNYKSSLQNYTQTNFHILPEYRVIEEKGPGHKKKYTIGVYIDNKKYAISSGFSKKQADRKAARKALEKISKEKEKDV